MVTLGPHTSRIPCPICSHGMGVSPWSFCPRCLQRLADEIERREENLKRRPTKKCCCAACTAEPVRFEYYLTPVRKSRRIYSGYRAAWYPLCDPCVRAWVMYGTLDRPEVAGVPVSIPVGGNQPHRHGGR